MTIAAVLWLVAFYGLGLAVLPLTMRVFGGLPDRGYGLSRIVGLVVVGWLAYLTAMLGFTAYVGPTVGVLAAVVAAGCWAGWGRECVRLVRERRWLLAAEELTFLAVFGVGTFVRAYNADIVGQEKFMDYAFVNALLRTTSLPAEDMWLSGFTMPYYYLGYLLAGLPAKIVGTPGPLAYSMAVIMVFASGFGAAFAIAYALVARARADDPQTAGGLRLDVASYLFGLLGGTLTMVCGNLVAVFELIAARDWGSDAFWAAVGVKGLAPALSPGLWPVDGGWWWRSSRVIANIQPDGITEFPYFSFILGDLHPHYLAIPFVLLVVALAASRWLDTESAPDLASLGLGGLALATLIPASTWDVPTFWGLYLLAHLGDAWRREGSRQGFVARLPALLIPFVIAALVVVPYFVGYQSQKLGLGIVKERTPLVSMLILFGPALLVAAILSLWLTARSEDGDRRQRFGRLFVVVGVCAVGMSAIREPTMGLLLAAAVMLAATAGPVVRSASDAKQLAPATLFCWLLSAWAVCVLLGTELIFLRDVFGSRMNTVFKFQYHAWLLLGIASAASLGAIWRYERASGQRGAWLWRGGAAIVALLVLVPGLAYPIGATWTKSNAFRGEPTLMGDRFLERGAQADYRAIEWLRQNAVGRPVVVEAVGGDYTEHARVSTFSGLPTLIGWVGHELQWRGDRPEFGPRQQAVDQVYRAENRDAIERVARLYHVKYVFFGSLERAKYGPEAQARLDKLLQVAYSRGGTTVYGVDAD